MTLDTMIVDIIIVVCWGIIIHTSGIFIGFWMGRKSRTYILPPEAQVKEFDPGDPAPIEKDHIIEAFYPPEEDNVPTT